MKSCCSCGLKKKHSDFNSNKAAKDSLEYKCRACEKIARDKKKFSCSLSHKSMLGINDNYFSSDSEYVNHYYGSRIYD